MNNIHFQNPLIPRKRRPQRKIEHKFDLKGEEKMGTLKREREREEKKMLSISIKGE